MPPTKSTRLSILLLFPLAVLRRLPLLLFPAAVVFLLESMSRVSFHSAWSWMTGSTDEWWLNYWIALALTLLVTALAGRTRVAYPLLFGLSCLIGLASGMKENATGAPLFLWNILLPWGTPDAVRPLNPMLTVSLLQIAAWLAGGVLVLLVIARFLLRVRFRWPERLLWGALGLLLLLGLYTDVPYAFQKNAHIFVINWDQDSNYERNGYLLSSLLAVDLVKEPLLTRDDSMKLRRLAREEAAKDSGSGSASGSTGTSATSGRAPNIIVILSESFWDPTKMKNVTFSEDPMPFFRSLMKTSTSGSILSPQFGGGTANVEFEVLTGNSMRFLPAGSIAYIEYANRGIDSLASILNRQGYTSTAFNPFFEWFFNSRNAYKSFGFSRFISSETFDPVFHGGNYEDKQVMSRIIRQTESTKGPDFIFANTMENHGPYKDKFYSNTIKVSGKMTEDTRNMLENYVTGAHAFDDAFKSLVEHYASSPEPTYILSFGDHLPTMGDKFAAYKDTGYISGDDDPDKVEKLYHTPFVLWTNTAGHERKELEMSPGFLGAYLLHEAGLPGSYYTNFLYNLSRRMPVIPPKELYTRYGIDPKDPGLQEYRQLQHDILFGQQVGYQETGIKGSIIRPDFALEYGQPVIQWAVKGKGQDGDIVSLAGDYLTSSCTVWVNGVMLKTEQVDEHHLRAVFEKGAVPPDGPWKVEVRLIDDKGSMIGRSQSVEVK